jgi:hypothetical protein
MADSFFYKLVDDDAGSTRKSTGYTRFNLWNRWEISVAPGCVARWETVVRIRFSRAAGPRHVECALARIS